MFEEPYTENDHFFDWNHDGISSRPLGAEKISSVPTLELLADLCNLWKRHLIRLNH